MADSRSGQAGLPDPNESNEPSAPQSSEPETPEPQPAEPKTHEPTEPPTTPPPNAKLLIGVLVAAAFVVILNETTLSVALPVLMREFTISADAAQWLVTSFMLTMAVVIPMTGYVMQRFSLRQVYSAAMLLFLAGTIIATLAPTFPILLLGRIVQASGTALVIPLLMTTIMRLIPVERRGGVFGLVSVVIAVAPALGPTFSGMVLHSLGWRWIFILMIPLVLIALITGIILVRNFEEPTRPYLDILSVILAAVGFASTIYGLAGLSELGNGIPWGRIGVLAGGVVILAVFFGRQTALNRAAKKGSKREPLLNLDPLRSREYTLSLSLMLLTFGVLFGFIILLPLFAQNVVGLSEQQTGLLLLPGGLIMGIMGPFVGRIYDARGTRVLTIPGSILMSAAMFGFAFMSESTTMVLLTVNAVVLNLGIALMMTPLMSNALAGVSDRLASHGQAILNTFQQVAAGGGTAIFIAIMTFASGAGSSEGASTTGSASTTGAGSASDAASAAGDMGAGIHVAFLVAAVASVVMVLFTVFVRLDAKKPLAS